MIKIVARCVVREDCIAQYQELAKELVAKSQAEEGNVQYSLNQSVSDPRVHVILECWKDQAAVDAHAASEHFKRIFRQMNALREERGTIELFHEVSW